jgi:hypothetical protein
MRPDKPLYPPLPPDWDSRDKAGQLAWLKAAAVAVLNSPEVRAEFEELIASHVFFACADDRRASPAGSSSGSTERKSRSSPAGKSRFTKEAAP